MYELLTDVVRFSPFLLKGAVYTVGLSAMAFTLGMSLGLTLCLCRMSKFSSLSTPAKGYIGLIRNTPLLLQLFYIYYALPELGIVLPAFVAGVIGLGVNYSAYTAEIFRAGIQSVDKGQVHAGLSIGLRSILIMRLIVLPQAIRNIFPALGNQAISMLKDSSLVAVISALDLMRSGQLLALSTFKYMLIYTMVAVLYFALSFVTARGLNRAERALQIPD